MKKLENYLKKRSLKYEMLHNYDKGYYILVVEKSKKMIIPDYFSDEKIFEWYDRYINL